MPGGPESGERRSHAPEAAAVPKADEEGDGPAASYDPTGTGAAPDVFSPFAAAFLAPPADPDEPDASRA